MVAEGSGSGAFFAQAVIYILATSLRFRHTLRHSFEPEHSTARTIFAVVRKGKSKDRHAFRVSCPTNVAPYYPLLARFAQWHAEMCSGAGFLVPDVHILGDGSCGGLAAHPMAYGKFTKCLRSLLLAPPAAFSAEEAASVTTYSLRPKLASVADRLGLSIQRRSELGRCVSRWAPHSEAAEPMAVRYSAARLETAASTRRLCLFATSGSASIG